MSDGEMVIQEVRRPDGSLRGLRLLRADERIKISADLLDLIAEGDASPFVTFVDGVFRVDALDGSVSYRVGERVGGFDNCYVADRISVGLGDSNDQ